MSNVNLYHKRLANRVSTVVNFPVRWIIKYMFRVTYPTLLLGFFLFLLSCESNVLEPLETGTVGFQYGLENEGYVLLEIKNRYNYVVKSFDEGIKPIGQHIITWDTTDNDGNRILEGIYFFYLYVDHELVSSERKIILLNP